jgi:hypothetical protein
MLDPLVIAAVVALVKVFFDVYLPQFPVSAELIYSIIVFLLGLFGAGLAKALIIKVAPKTQAWFKSE